MQPRIALDHGILFPIVLGMLTFSLSFGTCAPISIVHAAGPEAFAAVPKHATISEYTPPRSAAGAYSAPLASTIISEPRVPPAGFELKRDADEVAVQSGAILSVPTYLWDFGSGPTAAAMIAAYYDRNGYDQIYTGPTNGGVMPLDDSLWPHVDRWNLHLSGQSPDCLSLWRGWQDGPGLDR